MLQMRKKIKHNFTLNVKNNGTGGLVCFLQRRIRIIVKCKCVPLILPHKSGKCNYLCWFKMQLNSNNALFKKNENRPQKENQGNIKYEPIVSLDI